MLRPSSPRLLLLLPTVTYRTVAFVEAARRLGADLTVASERPSTFERANPTGLVTLDFADPTHAAAQAREFARAHPVHGVVAVDDDTAVVAAAIAEALGLRGNPVTAAAAARDKHQQRQLLATAGVAVPRFELFTVAADPERVASGVSYPCVLKPLRLARTAQQEIAACAQAAVDALGLRDGPIHAEVRHNDRGAWLIELAARPIGGRCSGALRFEIREAGSEKRETSLEEIIIRHALGMELPTLERERRAAGVMMIPVPGAGVLRDVRGVGAAQAVPLVEGVVITMHPGQPLVPWPEGSRYPGVIFARGGTAEGGGAALRAAHARLEFLTEPAD